MTTLKVGELEFLLIVAILFVQVKFIILEEEDEPNGAKGIAGDDNEARDDSDVAVNVMDRILIY